ncbi:hypothetical protein HYH02_013257 [Chlamydomonas schloesseri]|uniref:C2H2-type domain-containing protein n=1 Tax=Chlamydomonas schloesseri TaxID=2026947 RepID=A0A835VXL9_9CHLO|nr:hypothetical protein HYH02_013257 [Chlamydomonas schloesseri]|eukprot:KAG2431680.1 hypothetical protein HYH02_013257 [Chlamydomonas schloesseri]
MAELSDEPCPRCQEPAVLYDSTGGCFVCSSCGYVVAEQGFVAQHGPAVEHPGDAHDGAQGGGGRVVSVAAAAYAAAGGGRLDGGSGLAAGSFQDRLLAGGSAAGGGRGGGGGGAGAAWGLGGGSRQLRQRRELDTLRALAAALRLPGTVEAAAAGFLAQIHTAQAEAYRAACLRRQQQEQQQEQQEEQQPPEGYGLGNPTRVSHQHEREAVEWVDGDDEDDDGAGDTEADGEDDEAEADEADDGAGDGQPREGPAAARRRRLLEPPRTGGAMRSARLGGLLYLAARCDTCDTCDMYRLAQYARHQACFLRLTPLPAVDVERFVGRMARALLVSAGAAGAGGGGGGGGLPPLPGSGGAPAAGAVPLPQGPVPVPVPVPCDETALWRHPLSRRSGQLAALVVRRGWHEGRTPRTVAGAILSICLDGLYPGHRTQRRQRQQQRQQKRQQKRRRRAQGQAGRGGQAGGAVGEGEGEGSGDDDDFEEEGDEAQEGGGPLTVAALARHAMCAPRQLIQLKQELLGRLLQLSEGLPLAPGLLTRHNVAGQLELLLAAEAAGLGLGRGQG